MALKPPASSSNPREWQGSLPLGGAGVGSSITMKKNTWTEIIRFVVSNLRTCPCKRPPSTVHPSTNITRIDK